MYTHSACQFGSLGPGSRVPGPQVLRSTEHTGSVSCNGRSMEAVVYYVLNVLTC